MYSIFCLAFSLLLATQASPPKPKNAPYNVKLNVSLSLEDYLQDPSKIYLGEPFPANQDHQFQLEVSRRNDEIGTAFMIASVDPLNPKWKGVSVDIVYDCTVDDQMGLFAHYLGRSFERAKEVFIGVGFSTLTWGDLWEVKDSLPDGDELKFSCNIQLSLGQ